MEKYKFRSVRANALRYDVSFGDKTIPVYMPARKNVPGIHSIDEVAKGLAALPTESRDLVTKVNVNANRNPQDEFWEEQYHNKRFRSYMTSGESGVINIYPLYPKADQDYLDGSMIHETGHTLSQRTWGSDESDPRWRAWKIAAFSDGVYASDYAKNSAGEDFSETLSLYHTVRGTPAEAVVRARMPARMQILDELLKED